MRRRASRSSGARRSTQDVRLPAGDRIPEYRCAADQFADPSGDPGIVGERRRRQVGDREGRDGRPGLRTRSGDRERRARDRRRVLEQAREAVPPVAEPNIHRPLTLRRKGLDLGERAAVGGLQADLQRVLRRVLDPDRPVAACRREVADTPVERRLDRAVRTRAVQRRDCVNPCCADDHSCGETGECDTLPGGRRHVIDTNHATSETSR